VREQLAGPNPERRPFLDEALPWLRSLGPPAEVRIVFGFDS
jgi:hypothetical protein